MKKYRYFLYAMAIAVLLGACGGVPSSNAPVSNSTTPATAANDSTTSATTTTATTTTTSAAAPADNETTTIRIWSNGSHDKLQHDEYIGEFNNTKGVELGVFIEYVVYGGDFQTVLDVAIAADEEPEIYKSNPKTPQYIEMGKAVPLEEVAEAYPEFQKIIDEYAPFHTEYVTIFDNVVYCIPFAQNVFGMCYNKDLLSRAGYTTPPETWDEFVDACIAISNLEPGKVFGTGFPCKMYSFHDNYVMNSAIPTIGHFQFDNSIGHYNFIDLLPYFEMVNRITDGGGMFPGIETLDDDTIRAHFAEGSIGFLFGGSWNVGVWYDQFPTKMEWDVAPMPVQDPNNRYNGVATMGSLFSVSNQCRDRGILDKAGIAYSVIASDELRMKTYTAGKNIPVIPQLAIDAAPSELQQWTSFASQNTNVVVRPPFPDAVFTVEGDNYYTVFTQIITQTVDPLTALTDLDKRYNADLDKAVDSGLIDMSIYLDPSVTEKFIAGK